MRRLIPFALAGLLALAIAGPAAAQPKNETSQRAITNALVGVIVQAAVQDVEVVTISDSLNNLLQNAIIDVDVLNRSLNNVLQNVDVNVSDIYVLSPDGDLIVQVTILGDGIAITT